MTETCKLCGEPLSSQSTGTSTDYELHIYFKHRKIWGIAVDKMKKSNMVKMETPPPAIKALIIAFAESVKPEIVTLLELT